MRAVDSIKSCRWVLRIIRSTEGTSASALDTRVAGEESCGPRDAPGQKVSQIDELAVSLILDINDSIPVLPPPNRLAVNDDVRLTANDGKGDHLPDPGVEGLFFCVVLVRVERVETDVVVRQLSSDLEKSKRANLCERERRVQRKARMGSWEVVKGLTRVLNASRSSSVKESDLAMTGTTLTTSDNFFMTVTSICSIHQRQRGSVSLQLKGLET